MFVKADVLGQAGDQALPEDVGALDPPPALSIGIGWRGNANVGVCRQCPARKYDLFPHFCKRESLACVLKIPPAQQCGSESIWLLAAVMGKYSSVSKLFLNLRKDLWT